VSVWSEIFLGIIAFATLATAILQISVLVAAGRLARRVGRLVDQVETEMKPVFGHLNAIGRDASRAAALAAVQVERVDRLFTDLTQRVDEAVHSFQTTIAGPAREGRAVLMAMAAALRVIRGSRAGRSRSDEEDALFI
jgi:hypothetical protein